jgi:hypothetical protein
MRIKESLDKNIEHLEEEARMVLPGIQALFGFQLIAVFNQRFADMGQTLQLLHLVALCSTALATLLVLLPAAYHRQTEPTEISDFLCKLGTRSLTLSMLTVAVSLSLDLLVIAQVITLSAPIAVAVAGTLFAMLISSWFVFPQLMKHSSRR